MSYQVLARKWRPRVFREMVGQEHVLQALINALDHNRLHHAYLFTGTRGVGKTTIARILAKCLNCETGVSSEPCGQCSSCREIAEGRFVDLIEVDAASRTKVEDTRELLENVQYAPTRGRYKVYLIDEVHMLSNSSFNALLKTLEEPPPHVKFLLATTDPQKLPMTILSRCLQFNLKNMNPERIVQHLKFVLEKELVPFEESALWQLGRSADGSMRDAMSLTDQAISYGSGKITEIEVRAMLGTIDQSAVYEIVTALVSLDGQAVLTAVERMSEHAPDYASALAEMLSVLHRVAIAQALPEAVDNSRGDKELVMQLAQQLPPEDVQLFYQTALLGRRDLPLAPDPRAGFEMVMLRMLAFKPQGVMEVPTNTLPQANPSPVAAPDTALGLLNSPPAKESFQSPRESLQPSKESPQLPKESLQQPKESPQLPKGNLQPPGEGSQLQESLQTQQSPRSATRTLAHSIPELNLSGQHVTEQFLGPVTVNSPVFASIQANEPVKPVVASIAEEETPDARARVQQESPPFEGPYDDGPESLDDDYAEYAAAPAYYEAPAEVPDQKKSEAALPPVDTAVAVIGPEALGVPVAAHKLSLEQVGPENWAQLYLSLRVTGLLQSTVANCQLIGRQGTQFNFILDEANSTLYDDSHQLRLADLLSDYFIERVRVTIQPGKVTAETPAAIALRHRRERQAGAVASIKNDPIVMQLIEHFGASLREDTIMPL